MRLGYCKKYILGGCVMLKKTVAGYLENVADFTVDVLNEGICFFLFHQPPFPENARNMKEHKEEEENGKNSRFTN